MVPAERAQTPSATVLENLAAGNAAQDSLISACNCCCTKIVLGGSESLKGDHKFRECLFEGYCNFFLNFFFPQENREGTAQAWFE